MSTKDDLKELIEGKSDKSDKDKHKSKLDKSVHSSKSGDHKDDSNLDIPPSSDSSDNSEDLASLTKRLRSLHFDPNTGGLSSSPSVSENTVDSLESESGGRFGSRREPIHTVERVDDALRIIPPTSSGKAPEKMSSFLEKLPSVSEQLKAISKKEGDSKSFESRMEEKPKSLIEEYGDVKIFRIQGEPLYYYQIPVARPSVSERAIINTLKEAATRLISITPYKIRDPDQKRNVYAQQVIEILRASPELKVPSSKYEFYASAVVSEMIGYGLIDLLIKDDKLEEVMVIGPHVPVFVFHRVYDMMMTNVEFSSDMEIQDIVNRIAREVGRRVDLSSPLLDARLPDGSRVNATIPPASVSGSTLTVRKFRTDPFSIVDLIHNKTISLDVASFLWMCVDGLHAQPANILVSGGTSSGKTTMLNVLCSFIPSNERTISIEDTSELNLPLRHWIRLEGRPPGLEGKGEITLDILTKNSLRMRPDRIIVGEVRHNEAFSLFTAMNTGHDGCLTGDTKIALTNGVRPIGDFVDEWLTKGCMVKEGDWEACSVENEFVNSVDRDGKIFKSGIVQARRRPFVGTVYHVKLASGSEITCTGNHPFYVFNEKLRSVRADELEESQRIAAPRKLIREQFTKEPEIEYWSGLLHGDGNILSKQRVREKNGHTYLCNEGRISLYTEEESTIPKFVSFMKKKLNDTHVKVVAPRPEKNCFEVHISGFDKASTIQKMMNIPSGSRMTVPMGNSHYVSSLKEFVAGFFDAEGYVDIQNKAVVFTCANEDYIDFLRHSLLTEGILSRKYESKTYNSKWYRLYVYGINQVRKFFETYPVQYPKKVEKLGLLIGSGTKANTNTDLIECNGIIISLLKVAQGKGISIRKIARTSGLSQGLLNYYLRKKRVPSRESVQKLVKAFVSLGIDCSELQTVSVSDLFFDQIVSIHSFPYNGLVYDLMVNESIESGKIPHNFVAEGIVVGNSMGTIHANSAVETLVRITSPPMSVPQVMLSGLNFVLVENLFHSMKRGSYRRVTEVAEVYDVMSGNPKTRTIFEWDPISDKLERNNVPVNYLNRLSLLTGKTLDQIENEIKRRGVFLNGLVERNIRDLATVCDLAQQFLEEEE